ncbi:MAG: HAMP domain-containing histidine kinase [Candidatus Eremiobacteraeota bacterium]|nr:HAMP domain-containing histidine kinase [Candidatus Eremiobacteraeota bacterium]
MRSLRLRIATWYALLLVSVIVALGVIIAIRFDSILYAQAETRVDRTVNEIVLAADASTESFTLGDTAASSPIALLSSANLETWASPNTFIEVDTTVGYLLAHSGNMGAMRFPPAQKLSVSSPKMVRQVPTQRGPFLVEDRLISAGGRSAIVRVGEPMDQVQRAFNQTRQSLLVILGFAVAAVVLLSVFLAGQAINPINELERAMREIGSDRLDRRLKWKNRQDEIGRLAETFDDLLARLQEAFARERQFISDASHELRTPLTSINANAQMLVRWADKDETVRRESLETIVRESSSLAALVGGMLTLAKADSGEAIPKQPLSLADVAGDAVRGASGRVAEKGLEMHFEAQASPQIFGEVNLIRQLVTNLVDNAVKFTERGSVTVRVLASADRAMLEVEDTGPGIAREELPLVFDRFYRADRARNRDVSGTGLGLAIVRSIARVHEGTVDARAGEGGGALLCVSFPRFAGEV